jgi:hypothetical protein
MAASKAAGGLKKCLPQLISAIGSMGHIAFNNPSSSDVDELLGNSVLASSVVLAATQLLTRLGGEIDRRSSAELIQYIKVALNGLRLSFEESDQNVESLFFNQKLRCCIYRLQQETRKIKGCPLLLFSDFAKEKDLQCLKYLLPLIQDLDDQSIDWSLLISNGFLLNDLFDRFSQNAGLEELVEAIHSGRLNEANLIAGLDFVSSSGKSPAVDFSRIARIPGIWAKLPIEILTAAADQLVSFDASYLLKFPHLYRSPDQILESSSTNDVAQVVLQFA